LFYQRYLDGGNITLFSSYDVPDLYEAFYRDIDLFDRLYVQYEQDESIVKRTIPAVEAFEDMLMVNRFETGRVYVFNADHVNRQGAFIPSLAPVKMTNLCVHPDTWLTVELPDGSVEDITIKDLAETEFTRYKVMSHNTGTKVDSFQSVTNAVKTKKVKELISITTSKGNNIKVTPEHLVYTNNRGFVQAQLLLPSDELQET
jgi:ribonucleotide reductase alpha subunit